MNTVTTDYTSRADTLRSKKWNQHVEQKRQQNMIKSQGLSRDEYWKKHVKCKEDVIQFYQIYYPEYPDELTQAIASRLQKLLDKVQQYGQQCLNEDERKFLRKDVLQKTDQEEQEEQSYQSTYWDPATEINQEMLKGKIALAEKNMEQLLLEEEKDEKIAKKKKMKK